MRIPNGEAFLDASSMGRRAWLRTFFGAGIGVSSWAGTRTRATGEEWVGSSTEEPSGAQAKTVQPAAPKLPAEEDAAAIDEVRQRLRQAKIGPVVSARSEHYVAVGDAAQGFMKVLLADCEQLAADYMSHCSGHGLDVHPPQRALIVVLYQDERSFARYFQFRGGGTLPSGIYERKTNVLHVFDWRNVPTAPRSSHRNIQTLSHEGTHQLTFNTGLLSRDRDIPLCIVEGLGTYGEARQTSGHSDLGRLNLERMDDLARRQRQVNWIPLRELFTNDELLRAGAAARVLLAYAQSWVLVHFLIQVPEVLPRFRNYLKAIASRQTNANRLEDVRAHLGDMDKLDAELRRYAVRLQKSLP